MDALAARIDTHLRTLVADAGHRPPGSPANRRATDYVASVLRAADLQVEEILFTARWWTPGTARLVVDGVPVPIEPPPFCRTSSAHGPAVAIDSPADLEHVDAGAVLILRGPLAQPLFPKAFPFVQIPEQAELIAALEGAQPAAVLAAVAEDATEPVFEDPDLAFPYATVPVSVGFGIGDGRQVRLEVQARLDTGDGVNLSAGTLTGRRTVVMAHIDSKVETPGALDNASGVATLLALAEEGVTDLGPVELVFFNGEDHYAAPGEQAWLARRGLEEAELAVNIDGAGLLGYPAAVSVLGGDGDLEADVSRAMDRPADLVHAEPWFESDHAMFAMRGIPAIAVTSGAPFGVLKRLSHAPDDNPARLDPSVLADVARFVRSLVSSTTAAPLR